MAKSNKEARKKWKGSESRDRYPGNSAVMLFSCVRIGQEGQGAAGADLGKG